MIKAIIFDVFGVLITDVLGPMIEQLKESDPERASQIYGLIRATSRGDISRDEFTNEVARLLAMKSNALRALTDKGEAKNAPLFDYITELREHYKIAVLSNISVEAFQCRFSPQEIEAYFDVVVPSGEIGHIKPEPEAYLITAQKLGVQPSECVMIDDRRVCIDGAEVVGMRAVLYKSFAQCKTDLGQLLVGSL